MSDENDQQQNTGPEDEMRLCPTCRMKVSVWATKCHHCGEEVGRPRKEELKLTLKDLGGGQATTYAPSGNVTGALESFRVEEVTQAEALIARRQKVSLLDRLLGRKPPAAPLRPSTPALTELDEYNRNLSASILEDLPGSSSISISRSQIPRRTGPSARERIIQGVLLLIGLAVLIAGGRFAWGKVSDYLESRNREEVYVYNNRAVEMLARGEEPIVAFEEAMTALSYNNTPENQDIAGQVREMVLKQVDDLMSRTPWNRKDQDAAYAIMQRAVTVDSHRSIQARFESVTREIGLFKFVLKSVDSDGERATFRLNNPDFEPEVTVGKADRIMDRFIVVRISSREVDLDDDAVPGGRKLTISLNGGVQSRY